MKNTTLFLPGFHLHTLRKKPRSAQQLLADKLSIIKQKSLSQLADFLSKFIPSHYLQPEQAGTHSRRRIYSKENTFWGFFSQVLDADGGCQEVVRKLQAATAIKSMLLPSSSTAAYCQARKKLSQFTLDDILVSTSETLQSAGNPHGFHDRRVVVVDGTGLSMPDTKENQAVWPQQKSQKLGCGFPQATVCACFCLQTGGLLSYEVGNKKSHELPMLRQQWNTFKPGDIFLGDKLFCSYFDLANLKKRAVDSVVTLSRRLPVTETEAVKVLSEDDCLISWKKPKQSKQLRYSQQEWEALPDELVLRQIKVTVNTPGFRVSSFYIITTLLDADAYCASDISDLYFQRWNVELYFRDIKTTMGMDILRCKTPDMIHKEISMHLIAYNCIRHLIVEAAEKHHVDVKRMSFKGSLQALRQWEPVLGHAHNTKKALRRLIDLLYKAIASTIIPDRPGRREPRAVKRRPKPFQLLTMPRHEMKETEHRGRKRAKQP